MIFQNNNFITYTLFIAKLKFFPKEKFPLLLVKKLIVFSSKYTKPVKNAWNGRMLWTKHSPFKKNIEQKLFKQILYFSLKIYLNSCYHLKSPSYQTWLSYHCGRGHKFLVCDVAWSCNKRVMWLGWWRDLKKWANGICWG